METVKESFLCAPFQMAAKVESSVETSIVMRHSSGKNLALISMCVLK